jgi:cytochrome c oxidase subunit 2
MKLGRTYVRQVLAAALLLFNMVLLAGCGALGGPQNTFAPDGPVARDQRNLFLLVMWPALAIMVAVFVALVYIMIRYRRRGDSDPIPEQVHGNTRLELAWTIAPTILLIVIAVPTLMGIVKEGRAAGPDALPVTVHAIQWDWNFEYTGITDADGNTLQSDTLYIPVGRDVDFALNSIDVIHSFWVPKLAGKRDVIPGRTNHLRFSADTPGTYSGQCAEFCGIGHPIMKFDVIALSPEDFDAWVKQQLGGATSSPTPGP